MAENTLAEAANTNTEATAGNTPAHEPQIPDAVAQHELLMEQLADANWAPEARVAGQTEDNAHGGRSRGNDGKAEDTAGVESEGMGDDDDGDDGENVLGTAQAVTGDEQEADDDDHDGDRGAAQAPESKDKGKRFRFSDPADRQFAVLRKEGVAPDEAARIAYGIGAVHAGNGVIPGLEAEGQAGVGVGVGAAVVSGESGEALAARQQQLRGVDARLLAAGADEGLINGEIIELMRLRSDLAAEIKTEERFQRQAAQAQAAERARVMEQVMAGQREAKTAAMERFPSIGSEKSAVRREADRLTRLYGGSELLREASAPMQIAEQAAMNVARAQAAAQGTSIAVEFARLERAAAGAGSSGKAQPLAKAVAARKITPASGAQATQRPDQPSTEQEVYRAVQATGDPRAQHEALSRLLYGR